MCPFPAKNTEATDSGFKAKIEGLEKPVLNLDKGDPTMYAQYWENVQSDKTVTIPMSHGNAKTEDKFIVVGTGSTHLIQATMYALSHPSSDKPVNVVSAAPFYSGYREIADLVRSSMYKWEGDAALYEKDEPFIEMICIPNNPDGSVKRSVVAQEVSRKGSLVHDFAYLWPQYTPIEAPADEDIMLFTLSKCTGHAGSRIGWALVKDKSVAQRMVNFIVLSTIGVPKEAQLRAAKIMETIADSSGMDNDFFKLSRLQMKDRWTRLRKVVDQSNIFVVKDYQPSYSSYFQDTVKPTPAFAWLSCEYISDLSKFLQEHHKVLVRGGAAFGAEGKYVRVSMLGKDEEFNQFLERLACIQMSDLPKPDNSLPILIIRTNTA